MKKYFFLSLPSFLPFFFYASFLFLLFFSLSFLSLLLESISLFIILFAFHSLSLIPPSFLLFFLPSSLSSSLPPSLPPFTPCFSLSPLLPLFYLLPPLSSLFFSPVSELSFVRHSTEDFGNSFNRNFVTVSRTWGYKNCNTCRLGGELCMLNRQAHISSSS